MQGEACWPTSRSVFDGEEKNGSCRKYDLTERERNAAQAESGIPGSEECHGDLDGFVTQLNNVVSYTEDESMKIRHNYAIINLRRRMRCSLEVGRTIEKCNKPPVGEVEHKTVRVHQFEECMGHLCVPSLQLGTTNGDKTCSYEGVSDNTRLTVSR